MDSLDRVVHKYQEGVNELQSIREKSEREFSVPRQIYRSQGVVEGLVYSLDQLEESRAILTPQTNPKEEVNLILLLEE